MEAEGISKACRMKVMMNKPETSTVAMEPINSIVVSRCFSGCSADDLPLAGADFALFLFFAKMFSQLTSRIVRFQRTYSQKCRTVKIKLASLPPATGGSSLPAESEK